MRILLMSERPYLPQQIGGREMVIHETVKAFQRSGHQAAVMSGLQLGNWGFYKNRVISKLTQNEYPEDHRLGYPVYRGWSWKTGLGKVVHKVQPNFAVVESNSLDYLVALREHGIPAVIRLHDTALHALKGDPGQHLPSQFIAVSNYLADRFAEKYAFRPAVLPPLVHKERCATQTTRKKVVFVNPRSVKGGDIAISIAANCPDIPFLFFQAWTEDDEVRALKSRAKSLSNIEWRPSVMDAKELYKEAHTVLIPSQADETWGRIATEAHFSGIPVIASKRGGLIESVGPGGVLLDPKATINEWTEATQRLWNDEAEYEHLSQTALEYSNRPEIAVSAIMGSLMEILAGVSELMQRHHT